MHVVAYVIHLCRARGCVAACLDACRLRLGGGVACRWMYAAGVGCSGVAQMTSSVIASVDHGVVATIKRVLMDRDTYDMRWGYGPRATEKKKMILSGLLDKKGKPNEKTPASWLKTEG